MNVLRNAWLAVVHNHDGSNNCFVFDELDAANAVAYNRYKFPDIREVSIVHGSIFERARGALS